MPNLPTEVPVTTGPEQIDQPKPPEQQSKPVSQSARDFLGKIAFWKEKSQSQSQSGELPNPDPVFQKLAEGPAQESSSNIMADQSTIDNQQPQSPEADLKDQCRGEIIVGPDDPGNMSLEEFRNSEHLLYHGALFHFQIDRSWTRYEVGEDSSLISGSGFYTTPSRIEAEHYSSIRQTPPGVSPKEDVTPVVLEVMPYLAKMYDFTTGNNVKPGVVPDAFLQDFINFLRNTPDSTKPDESLQETKLQPDAGAPAWLQELNNNFYLYQRQYYADILEKISEGLVDKIPAEITINELRRDDYKYKTVQPKTGMDDIDAWEEEEHRDHKISSDGKYQTQDGKYIVDYTIHNYRPKGELLRLFLQSKGYDGLISSVIGDNDKLQKPHLEHVFFSGSLNKIGTYDQWKQEKESETADTSQQAETI